MMKSKKRMLLFGALAAVALLAGGIAIVVLTGAGQGERTEGIYAAWYVEGAQGPSVIVQHAVHKSASHSVSGDVRYDQAASSESHLYSHSIAGGALLGSLSNNTSRILSVWKDKLWLLHEGGDVELFDASDLSLIAGRTEILEAVGSTVGGDYELGAQSLSFYTGQLGIKGANGKPYWVGTDLQIELADPRRSVIPEDRYCGVDTPDLIEETLALCLGPDEAPVTAIAKSYDSALKNKPRNVVLSGLESNYQSTRILWSHPLAHFVEEEEAPILIGKSQAGVRRVVLMIRTGTLDLHLVFIDPVDGSVLERARLFGVKSPPGT